MQTCCCRIPQPHELILKGCDSDNAILRHHFKTANEWTKTYQVLLMFMNTLSDINFISPDYPCSLLLWLTFKHLSANLIWIFCKIENCFCAIFCDGTQTEILLTWSTSPAPSVSPVACRVTHVSHVSPSQQEHVSPSRSTCAAMFMCHKMFAVLGLSLVFLVKLRYRGMSQNDQLSLH